MIVLLHQCKYNCTQHAFQSSIDSLNIFREIFYVRNHLPVPDVDVKSFQLEIEDESNSKNNRVLNYDDLMKFPKSSVTAAIMCGGNRRSEMHNVKPVKGLSWGAAAVGNAVWSGPKLCDILKEMGIESDDTRHVHVSILPIEYY